MRVGRLRGGNLVVGLSSRKDLCPLPLSELSLSRTESHPTVYMLNHKSASVNLNRIARFEASAPLIVSRYESLSRGIMTRAKYCFRLKYHRDRSPEKQNLPSATYSRLRRTDRGVDDKWDADENRARVCDSISWALSLSRCQHNYVSINFLHRPYFLVYL